MAINEIYGLRDRFGNPLDPFALPFSEYTDAKALAANTNESVTIPTGATHVVISTTNAATWVKLGGTATVPGDTADGTASDNIGTNPRLFSLPASATAIGVISNATPIVTFAFYKLD